MALLDCQECSEPISETASSCPSCGYAYSTVAVTDSSIGFLPAFIPRLGLKLSIALFLGGMAASLFGFPIGANVQALGVLALLVSVLFSI